MRGREVLAHFNNRKMKRARWTSDQNVSRRSILNKWRAWNGRGQQNDWRVGKSWSKTQFDRICSSGRLNFYLVTDARDFAISYKSRRNQSRTGHLFLLDARPKVAMGGAGLRGETLPVQVINEHRRVGLGVEG